MTRQHSAPILLTAEGSVSLSPTGLAHGASTVSEADIQALIDRHPQCLPIEEIDPMFIGAVSICRELGTSAGPIDNFLVTPSGLPVIVECKLWRNPEGRREVVGQILDYAKELSRWSSSDVQREVRIRLKRDGDPVLDLVRAVDPSIDEIHFNDALTANLRRGRFLLLIVGDGIREGVEAIAEYLQQHAGLHFSLGLVELPIYAMPDGTRLVVPRVLARTYVVTRTVVAVPDGFKIQDESDTADDESIDPERLALGESQHRFWSEFLHTLKLDDPEQPRPKPARFGWLAFMLPAPSGSSWLTVFRNIRAGEVGIFLSSTHNTAGEIAKNAIAADWDEVSRLIGGTVQLEPDKYGGRSIEDRKTFGSFDDPEIRRRAFQWLSERTNTFVNVLRPRVRSAVADHVARQAASGQSTDIG